jgi:hypothetical protein
MLAEEELTPDERRVLAAIRAGLTLEAIETILEISKHVAKA